MENIDDFKFKTIPYKHQRDTFYKTRRLKNHALLMEMGTGKTKICIDTMAYMYSQGFINAVAIIGPSGSYLNWVEELIIHMPGYITYVPLIWKSKMTAKEENAFYNDFHSLSLKVLIMNVEAVNFKRSANIIQKFICSNKTLTIIDESTIIKNPKAKRTKFVHTLGVHSVARRILTGSVIDNSPLNAWSQFQFLGNGLLGHTSYYSFCTEYGEYKELRLTSGRTIKVIKGYKNLPALQQSIAAYSTIIKKEDCLDLPKKLYQRYNIELTDTQLKIYTEFKKECCLLFSQMQVVTAKIALTQIIKLQQILLGYIILDDGKIKPLESNRLNSLLDILEETNGKVLIWSYNVFTIQMITQKLIEIYGQDLVQTYYGETSMEDRSVVRKEFKRGAMSNLRFLVANPTSAGYGLNLTGITTVIYYDNDFDAEIRNQSEDRTHRIGQTESVLYIDLYTKGTVEEKILNRLREKKELSASLIASNWQEFF